MENRTFNESSTEAKANSTLYDLYNPTYHFTPHIAYYDIEYDKTERKKQSIREDITVLESKHLLWKILRTKQMNPTKT